MGPKKIPYKWILWIFGGYLSIRMLVVLFGVVVFRRIFDVSGSGLILLEAYSGIFGEAFSAFVAWALVSNYYQFRASNAGKVELGLVGISRRQLMLSVLGGFVLGAVTIFLGSRFPSSSSGDASALDMYMMNGPVLRYSWLVLGIVVAPFVEELLVRGVVFSVIKSHTHVIFGAVGSVIFFLLLHLPQIEHGWSSALAIFALSLVCALIRAGGMSLWMAVIVHGSYNAYLTLWAIIYA